MTAKSSAKAKEVIAQQLESIDTYLQAVHEILEGGHMPDMAGLDDRVAFLCETIESATNDVREDCLPKLDALLKKIDACEDEVIRTQKKTEAKN